MKTGKKKGGFWEIVGTLLLLCVIAFWVFKGGRYLLDADYRAEIDAKHEREEIRLLTRKAAENQQRWILNGCNVPGRCDELGYRLDGTLPRN